MRRHQNLIGGEWVDAAGGAVTAVVDPADDTVLAEVQRSEAVDAVAAVDAAAAAFPAWSARTGPDRSRVLRDLFDLVVANGDRLAETIAEESGKPLSEARGEVAYGSGFLEWAAEEAKRVYGETVPASRPEQRILVLRQPVGVTAAITPWNFPLAMLTAQARPGPRRRLHPSRQAGQ